MCDCAMAVLERGGGGVTEGNLLQYLGLIEQRTNEILQMYAAVQLQVSLLLLICSDIRTNSN